MAELGELFYSAGIKIDDREYNKLTNLATVLGSIKGERTVMLKVDGGYVKEGLNKFKQRIDSFVNQTEESTKIKLSVDIADFKIGKNIDEAKAKIAELNEQIQSLRQTVAPTINSLKIDIDTSAIANAFGIVNEYTKATAEKTKDLKSALDIAFAETPTRLKGFAHNMADLATETQLTNYQKALEKNIKSASTAIDQYVKGTGGVVTKGTDNFKVLMKDMNDQLAPMIGKYESMATVIRTLREEMLNKAGGKESAVTKRMTEQAQEIERVIRLLTDLSNLSGKSFADKSRNLNNIIATDEYKELFANKGLLQNLNLLEKRIETVMYNLGGNVPQKVSDTFKGYTDSIKKMAGTENLANITIAVNGFEPAIGSISALRTKINKYLNESFETNPIIISNISIKDEALIRIADQVRKTITSALSNIDANINANIKYQDTTLLIPPTPPTNNTDDTKNTPKNNISSLSSTKNGESLSEEDAAKLQTAKLKLLRADIDNLNEKDTDKLVKELLKIPAFIGIYNKVLSLIPEFNTLNTKEQLKILRDRLSNKSSAVPSETIDRETERLKRSQADQEKALRNIAKLKEDDFVTKNDKLVNLITDWIFKTPKEREQYFSNLKTQLNEAQELFSKIDLKGINPRASVSAEKIKEKVTDALEATSAVKDFGKNNSGLKEIKLAEMALYQSRKAMEIIASTTALNRGSNKPLGIPELREGMSTTGGGKVVGKGTATSDSILLHASNGEWVMNAAATKMFQPFLLAANQLGRGEADINHVVETLRSMGLSNSTVNTVAVGELFVSAQKVSVIGQITEDRGGKTHKDKGNEIWRAKGSDKPEGTPQNNWTKKQRNNKLADILNLKAEAENLVKTRNQTYSMMEKESSQFVRDKLKTLVDDYDKQLQEKKQTLETKIQEYISRAGKSSKKDADIDFDKLFNLKGPKAPKPVSLDKFDATKAEMLGKLSTEIGKIESNQSILEGNAKLQERLALYKELEKEVNNLKKDEAGLARLNEIKGTIKGMGASNGAISQARQNANYEARLAKEAEAAERNIEKIITNFTENINVAERLGKIWRAIPNGSSIYANAIKENDELLEVMKGIRSRKDVAAMERFMSLPLSVDGNLNTADKYLREYRSAAGFEHTLGAISEKERRRIEAENERRAKEEAVNNAKFRGAVDKRSAEIASAQAELDNYIKKTNNALAIFNKPATVTMGDGAAAHTTTVNAAASQNLANNVLATIQQIENGKWRDIPAALEQAKNQIKNDLMQSGKLFNQAYKDAREDAKQQSVGKQLNLRNDQDAARLQGLIDKVNTTITTPDPQRAGTGKFLREVITDATDAITKLQAVQQELDRINKIADPSQRKLELAKFATDIQKLLGDVTTAFSNAQNNAKTDALNQSNRAKALDQYLKDLNEANNKIAKEYGKYQSALNRFNNPESFTKGQWTIVTDAKDALNIISKIKAELDAISVKSGQDKINAINKAVNSGLFDTLRKDAGIAYGKARKDALDTAIGLDNIDKEDAKKAAEAQRALNAAQKAFNSQISKLDSEIGNLMQRRGTLIGAGKGYSIIESRIGELENIKATSIASVNPNDIASLEAETKALQDNLKARRELTAQRKEEQKNANKPTPPVPPTPPTPKGGPTPPVPPSGNPNKVNAELKKQEDIAHRLNQQLKRLRADRDKGQEFGKETAEIDKVIKKYERFLEVVRRLNNSGELIRGMDSTKFFRILTTQTKVARDADAMIDKQAQDWARATNTQKGFESQTLQTLKSVFSLDQQFSMLASNIQNAFSILALQQFADRIIQIGGELERQQLAMSSIFGDARKAESIYQDVADLSMKSPFDVQDLLKNTKQLSAFGVQYQDLYDWTKRLSDIAAAVGVDFSRIGYEFGQMISMDYLDARHLRMFSMSGIPLIQQLTEHYSQQQGREVGVEEVRKMISKRDVGADVVKDILKDMTNEGGRFYNMQEIMAESLASKWRNLSNAQNLMYGELAKSGWGEFLKSIAEGLTAITKQWDSLGTSVVLATVAMTAWKTMVTITNFLTGKQTISSMAAAMATKELTVAEMRQVEATGILNASELQHLKNHKYLTAAAAKRLITSKQLTSAQFAELASTLSLSRGQMIAALSTQQLKVAQIAARLHATGLNKTIAAQCAWLTRLGGIGPGIARMWASLGGFIASNPWTAGIAAVATVVGLFVWWRKEADKLKDALAEIDQNSANNREQEAESMRELVRRATDHNAALEARKTAQEQLMSQFGEYFKDIDLESAAYENLTENVDAATEAIRRKAEVTAAEDKVKKIVENRENELGFQDDFMNNGLGYKLKKRLTGYNAGIGDGENMARYIIDMLRTDADVSDEEIERAVSKRWGRFKTFGIIGNSIISDIREVIKKANKDMANAINPTGLSDVWVKEIEAISAAYDEAISKEKEHNRQLELEAEKNETIFKTLSSADGEKFTYDINGKTYKGRGIGLNAKWADVKQYKDNAEKQRRLLSRDWAMAINEVVYDWNIDKSDMKHQFANRNGFKIGVSTFSSTLAPKSDQEFIVWAADIAKKKKDIEDDLNKWKINPQGDEASLRSVATLEETMARIVEMERRLGISFDEYAKNGDKANKKEVDNLNKRIDNLKRAYDEYKRLVDAYGKEKAEEIWHTTDRYRSEFEGITLRDLKDIKRAFRDVYKTIPKGKDFQEVRNKLDETVINIGIDIDKESVQQAITKLNKIIEGEIKQWDFFRNLIESGVSDFDARKLSLGGITERLVQTAKEALEKSVRETYAKSQGDAAANKAEIDYAAQSVRQKTEAEERTKRETAIEMEQFAGLALPTRALNHIMQIESGTTDRIKANLPWRVDYADKSHTPIVVGGYQTAYDQGTPEYNKYVGIAMRGEALPLEEAQALFASKMKGFVSAVDAIRKQVSNGGKSITEGMYTALLSAVYKNGPSKFGITSKLSKVIINNPYDFEKIKPLWDELYTVQNGEKLTGKKLDETQMRANKDWAQYISTSASIGGEDIISLDQAVNEARSRAVEEAQNASLDMIKLAAISDDKINLALNALESFNPDDLSSMGITDLASYLQYIVKMYLTGIGKELESDNVGGMMGIYQMTDTQLKEEFKGEGEANFIKSLVEKWYSEEQRLIQDRQKLVQKSVNDLNKLRTEQQRLFNETVKTIKAIQETPDKELTPERKLELIEGEKNRYEDNWQQMVIKADANGVFGNAFALTKKQIEESANTLRDKAKEAFVANAISAEEYGKRIKDIDDQEQKAIERNKKDFFGLLPKGGILGSKERDLELAQQELDTAIQEAQVAEVESFHNETIAKFNEAIAAIKGKSKSADASESGETTKTEITTVMSEETVKVEKTADNNSEPEEAEDVTVNTEETVNVVTTAPEETTDSTSIEASDVTNSATTEGKSIQSVNAESNIQDNSNSDDSEARRKKSAENIKDKAKNVREKRSRLDSFKNADGIIKNFSDVIGVASDSIGKLGGEGSEAQMGLQIAGDAAGAAAGVMSGNYAQALQSFMNIIVQLSGLTKQWLHKEAEAAKARAELWRDSYDQLTGTFSDTGYNSYLTLNRIATLNSLFLNQMQRIGSDVSKIEQQARKSSQGEFNFNYNSQFNEALAEMERYQEQAEERGSFMNKYGSLAFLGFNPSGFINGIGNGDWKNILTGGLWDSFAGWFGGDDRKAEYYRRVTQNINEAQTALHSFLNVESDAEANTKLAAIKARGDAMTETYIAGYYQLLEQRKEIANALAAEESNKGKDQDEDAIREYRKQLEELNKEIVEYVHKFAAEVYDLDITSWTETLSDALVDAFKNGEDAAEKFHDTVNDILEDVWNKVIQHVVFDPFIKAIDEKIFGKADHNGVLQGGIFSEGAVDNVNEAVKEAVSFLKGMMDSEADSLVAQADYLYEQGKALGLYKTESGSSTSASIQGITEETADILAAYINGMRGDLSIQRSEVEWIRKNTDEMLKLMTKADSASRTELVEAARQKANTIEIEPISVESNPISSFSAIGGVPSRDLEVADMQDSIYGIYQYTFKNNVILGDLNDIVLPEVNATLDSQLEQLRQQTDYLNAINQHTKSIADYTRSLSDHIDKVVRNDEQFCIR